MRNKAVSRTNRIPLRQIAFQCGLVSIASGIACLMTMVLVAFLAVPWSWRYYLLIISLFLFASTPIIMVGRVAVLAWKEKRLHGKLSRTTRLGSALAVLGCILWMVGVPFAPAASILHQPFPCPRDGVCGSILLTGERTDAPAARWFSDALRQHPRGAVFRLVMHDRNWDVYLNGDYRDITYDRRVGRLEMGWTVCGCGDGWDGVTPDKIHRIAAHNGDFEELNKLGCTAFP